MSERFAELLAKQQARRLAPAETYVFDTGNWFDSYHWIPTKRPIRLDANTDIVGLVFLPDPSLLAAETPHGHVPFFQPFGLTQSELNSLKKETRACEKNINYLRQTNPLNDDPLMPVEASPRVSANWPNSNDTATLPGSVAFGLAMAAGRCKRALDGFVVRSCFQRSARSHRTCARSHV